MKYYSFGNKINIFTRFDSNVTVQPNKDHYIIKYLKSVHFTNNIKNLYNSHQTKQMRGKINKTKLHNW